MPRAHRPVIYKDECLHRACAPYNPAEIGAVPYALALLQERGYETNITQFAAHTAEIATDHILQKIRSVSVEALSTLGIDDMLRNKIHQITDNAQERIIKHFAAPIDEYIAERKIATNSSYSQIAASPVEANSGYSGVAAGDSYLGDAKTGQRPANDNEEEDQEAETKNETPEVMIGDKYVAGSEKWGAEDNKNFRSNNPSEMSDQQLYEAGQKLMTTFNNLTLDYYLNAEEKAIIKEYDKRFTSKKQPIFAKVGNAIRSSLPAQLLFEQAIEEEKDQEEQIQRTVNSSRTLIGKTIQTITNAVNAFNTLPQFDKQGKLIDAKFKEKNSSATNKLDSNKLTVLTKNELTTPTENINFSGNTAKDVVVADPLITKRYIKEIEKITDKAVTPEQVSILKNTLQAKEFVKLDKSEQEQHRKIFKKVLPNLRQEWEINTGQTWPVYESHSNPKRIGKPFDAHHIIQSNHGGPNEWWNIHPAHGLEEHPKIHGTGSEARNIFNKPTK